MHELPKPRVSLLSDPSESSRPDLMQHGQRALSRAQARARHVLGKPTAQTAFASYATLAISGGAGILLARTLGPRGRGELAAIQTWPNVLGTLALLGLPESIVYFAAKNRNEAARYAATATSIAIVSSSLVTISAVLILPVLLHNQSASTVRTAQIYSLIILLYSGGLSFNVLRAHEKFPQWNLLRLLPSLSWSGIVAVAFITKLTRPGPIALSQLASAAIMVIPFVVVTKRAIRGSWRPQRALVGPLLRYGLPNAATVLPQVLNLSLDQMIMVAAIPARDLGLYVVSVGWASLVSPAILAIGTVAFPAVASLDSPTEQQDALALASRRAVLISATLAVTAASLSPWGIALLFGPAYRGAIPAGVVLSLAVAVRAYAHVLQEGLRGLGRPSWVLGSEAIGLASTGVFLALLLPARGILGAAIASLLAYTTVLVVLLTVLARVERFPLRSLLVPTAADARSIVSSTRLHDNSRATGR